MLIGLRTISSLSFLTKCGLIVDFATFYWYSLCICMVIWGDKIRNPTEILKRMTSLGVISMQLAFTFNKIYAFDRIVRLWAWAWVCSLKTVMGTARLIYYNIVSVTSFSSAHAIHISIFSLLYQWVCADKFFFSLDFFHQLFENVHKNSDRNSKTC